MKKILISLGIIAVVAAIATGVTISYFSDTEVATGNTLTAGTIDIDIDGQNRFSDNFAVGDLKPGEVGYMNFKINNVGLNPVNVSKSLYNFEHTDSDEGYFCEGVIGGYVSSDPECVAETSAGERKDLVATQILYDLSVEVYDVNNNKIWWQTIYEVDGTGDKSLDDVYGNTGQTFVSLGMIPAKGYMLVTQSYHFDINAGNEYQGDGLTFNMDIKGEQLTGTNGTATVVLENKTYSGGDWVINSGDTITGTLEYETNGPEFVYTVSGKAPAVSTNYVLAIGYDVNTNVDTFVINVTSDTNGDFLVSGSKELGSDMMGVKAWLVPATYWDAGTQQVQWTNWNSMVSEFLWETGLVWYNDTDS
ncbi:MAG: TasA family protein [bacterium]